MEQPLILVVDDDPHIREVLVFALGSAGFLTLEAGNGEEALDLFKKNPALVVLDINLPGRDGLWVCQKIREFSQTPILFLSARDEEVDRVMGLTIGGDDYVSKPFSPRELVARVRAILRRPRLAPSQTTETKSIKNGRLELNLESFEAFWEGRPVDLTATEFQLLKTLLRRPNKVFSREELLDLVYPGTAVSDRTIDSHVLHIRKKFNTQGAAEVIQTQHGFGYKAGTLGLK